MRLIMLPAPTVDTFETRMECRANKLTLTTGEGSKLLGTVRSLPLVK